MVDKIIKFIHKSLYRERLLKFLEDLEKGNIDQYDIKPYQGTKNTFRCRIGNVRIIFEKTDSWYWVIKIDNRGDIY